MLKFKRIGGLVVAAAFLVLLAKGSSGCGSGGGGGGSGAAVSTDAAANLSLITNFINAGLIKGTWRNNNFGSSGAITITPSFDTATNKMTVIVDIDGNVFGGADPDPETFTVDMTDFIKNGTATVTLHSDTYGDITGTVTFLSDGTGTFTATATNIPAGATNASTSGTFSISGTTVTYAQKSASFTFSGTPITVSSTF